MRTLLAIALVATLGGWRSLPTQTPESPAPRGGHSMAYDQQRGVTLMFGGGSREQAFGDLWAWDGTRWRVLSTTGPAPRNSATFDYDERRKVTTLVGGRTPGGIVDETWEWDGRAWHERKVNGPGVRLHHVAAYDRKRGRLVLYGGLKPLDNKSVERLTDTWEWDGDTWARRDTRGFAAFPNAIAYDEQRGQVVIVAVDATAPPDGERPSAVWAWDGAVWTRTGAGFGDPPLSPMQPLSPAPRGLLLLDGAMHKGNAAMTWLWRDNRWIRSEAAPPTPQRVSHAMAFDARRRRVVMFGGHAGFMPGRNGQMFGDTWEWTGEAWEQKQP